MAMLIALLLQQQHMKRQLLKNPDLAALYGRSTRRVRKVTAVQAREVDTEDSASHASAEATSVSEKADNSGEEAGSTR